MKKHPFVPINCYFQARYYPEYQKEIKKCKEKCHRYSQLSPNDRKGQEAILSVLIGKVVKNVMVTPPFWCDYGYNITLGDFFIPTII